MEPSFTHFLTVLERTSFFALICMFITYESAAQLDITMTGAQVSTTIGYCDGFFGGEPIPGAMGRQIQLLPGFHQAIIQ